ncbi:MAG: MarP family serine protease [Gaiellaceae bacterium]
MALADWLAVAFILVLAFGGSRKGLFVGGLSLVGVVGGLYLGARLAPVLFSGSNSPYTPLVALAGALVLAIAMETVGALTGGVLRDALKLTPFRLVDALGGLVLGVATAIAVLWIVAAVAFHLPQSSGLRDRARESAVLSKLISTLPPQDVMSALAGIDPFPLIVGPAAPSQAPDSSVLARAGLRLSERSVVRVRSEACGIGYAGSGWVAKKGYVVTAAHVVAGGNKIAVQAQGHSSRSARVVAFDANNDLALLSVPGLGVKPLRMAAPDYGDTGAVLGYPGDGPFKAEAVRVGSTSTLFSPNYAGAIVSRSITSLRGKVRPGDSGGPVVNGQGAVEMTVFGAKKGTDVGYGTSSELARALLEQHSYRSVSTGACLD